MPMFFAGSDKQAPVGRTIACKDRTIEGTTTFLSMNPAIQWSSERSIITRITLSQSCNFQMLHMLGNDVYIYRFGDRVSQMTISGLSMSRDCGSVEAQRDTEHGIEKMLRWYKKNRLTARREPLYISIGKFTIEAFAVGITGDLVDPSTRLMQYNLSLITIPEKT